VWGVLETHLRSIGSRGDSVRPRLHFNTVLEEAILFGRNSPLDSQSRNRSRSWLRRQRSRSWHWGGSTGIRATGLGSCSWFDHARGWGHLSDVCPLTWSGNELYQGSTVGISYQMGTDLFLFLPGVGTPYDALKDCGLMNARCHYISGQCRNKEQAIYGHMRPEENVRSPGYEVRQSRSDYRWMTYVAA